MKGVITGIFFSLAFSCISLAQDEEKKPACPEPENKKAIDLYKKGIDKKKYKNDLST